MPLCIWDTFKTTWRAVLFHQEATFVAVYVFSHLETLKMIVNIVLVHSNVFSPHLRYPTMIAVTAPPSGTLDLRPNKYALHSFHISK